MGDSRVCTCSVCFTGGTKTAASSFLYSQFIFPANICFSLWSQLTVIFCNCVTECIVHFLGPWPFYLSFCHSFSFLIGWKFYGPNIWSVKTCTLGPPCPFPQCPCRSKSFCTHTPGTENYMVLHSLVESFSKYEHIWDTLNLKNQFDNFNYWSDWISFYAYCAKQSRLNDNYKCR